MFERVQVIAFAVDHWLLSVAQWMSDKVSLLGISKYWFLRGIAVTAILYAWLGMTTPPFTLGVALTALLFAAIMVFAVRETGKEETHFSKQGQPDNTFWSDEAQRVIAALFFKLTAVGILLFAHVGQRSLAVAYLILIVYCYVAACDPRPAESRGHS